MNTNECRKQELSVDVHHLFLIRISIISSSIYHKGTPKSGWGNFALDIGSGFSALEYLNPESMKTLGVATLLITTPNWEGPSCGSGIFQINLGARAPFTLNSNC